jgi:hypothetical protein
MHALAALRRHPLYRDALISQLAAIVLCAMGDGLEHFATLILPAWVLYWVGLVLFIRFRASPTKAELFLVRFGPIFVFILMFVVAQYL